MQMFSCRFCKFFKNTFFTEYVSWLRLKKKGYFFDHVFDQLKHEAITIYIAIY